MKNKGRKLIWSAKWALFGRNRGRHAQERKSDFSSPPLAPICGGSCFTQIGLPSWTKQDPLPVGNSYLFMNTILNKRIIVMIHVISLSLSLTCELSM